MQVQNIPYNTNTYYSQPQRFYPYQNQVVRPVTTYPAPYTYQFYQPKNYQAQQGTGGILETAQKLYPPQPQKPFSYKTDELPYVNNPNKPLEEYLLEKKDYGRLVEYNDYKYNQTNYPLIGKYLSTPEFKELAQNKHFSDENGFNTLIDIIAGLAKEQQKAYNLVHNPNYRSVVLPDMNSIYAGFDIGQAIKNINKFFSSKLSEDLKTYILKETDKLNNLYWVSTNLSYLDKDNPSIDALSSTRYAAF